MLRKKARTQRGSDLLFFNSPLTRMNQNPTRIASISESSTSGDLMISSSVLPVKGPTISNITTLEPSFQCILPPGDNTQALAVCMGQEFTVNECLLVLISTAQCLH